MFLKLPTKNGYILVIGHRSHHDSKVIWRSRSEFTTFKVSTQKLYAQSAHKNGYILFIIHVIHSGTTDFIGNMRSIRNRDLKVI